MAESTCRKCFELPEAQTAVEDGDEVDSSGGLCWRGFGESPCSLTAAQLDVSDNTPLNGKSCFSVSNLL